MKHDIFFDEIDEIVEEKKKDPATTNNNFLENSKSNKDYNLWITKLGAKTKLSFIPNKMEKQLFYYSLWRRQINFFKNSDEKNKKKIIFSVIGYAKLFDIKIPFLKYRKKNSKYNVIQEIAEKVSSIKIFTWEDNDENADLDDQKWEFLNVFESFKYDRGKITLELTKYGKRFYNLVLSNYINFNIKTLKKFKHKYSSEIYRYFLTIAYSKKKIITSWKYKKIRDFLRIGEMQYKQWNDFNHMIIKPSIFEINKETNVIIEFKGWYNTYNNDFEKEKVLKFLIYKK